MTKCSVYAIVELRKEFFKNSKKYIERHGKSGYNVNKSSALDSCLSGNLGKERHGYHFTEDGFLCERAVRKPCDLQVFYQ